MCSVTVPRTVLDFSAEGRFWERRDAKRRAAVLVKEEGLEAWAVAAPEMGRVEYLKYLDIGIYRYSEYLKICSCGKEGLRSSTWKLTPSPWPRAGAEYSRDKMLQGLGKWSYRKKGEKEM